MPLLVNEGPSRSTKAAICMAFRVPRSKESFDSAGQCSTCGLYTRLTSHINTVQREGKGSRQAASAKELCILYSQAYVEIAHSHKCCPLLIGDFLGLTYRNRVVDIRALETSSFLTESVQSAHSCRKRGYSIVLRSVDNRVPSQHERSCNRDQLYPISSIAVDILTEVCSCSYFALFQSYWGPFKLKTGWKQTSSSKVFRFETSLYAKPSLASLWYHAQ